MVILLHNLISMRKLYQFLIFIVSNWFKNILDHSLNVNLLKVFHSLLLLIIFIVILFLCFGSNIFFILAFYNFKIVRGK